MIIMIIAISLEIYTTWLHNGILSILSEHLQTPINTARGEREDGEWVSQLQQRAATN